MQPRDFTFNTKDSMAALIFEFHCGLHGYHEYKSVWTPIKNQNLSVEHEPSNPFDRYAIAAVKHEVSTRAKKIVGHLPKETS